MLYGIAIAKPSILTLQHAHKIILWYKDIKSVTLCKVVHNKCEIFRS